MNVLRLNLDLDARPQASARNFVFTRNRPTFGGLFVALSASVRFAVRDPVAVGLQVNSYF